MLFRVKILYDLIFSFKKPAVVLNAVCLNEVSTLNMLYLINSYKKEPVFGVSDENADLTLIEWMNITVL